MSPVSRIVSKEGVAALYSGLVPGLQRQMAFSAIRIGRQEYHKCFLLLFTIKTLGHQVGPPTQPPVCNNLALK